MRGYINEIQGRGPLVLLFSIYIITSSMALNHGDTTLDTPVLHILFVIVKSLSLYSAVIVFAISKYKNNDSRSIYYFIPYFIFLIVSSYFSIDGILAFGLFALLNNKDKLACLCTFRDYLVVSSFIGIIAYMSFVIGLPIPFSIVPLYGDISGSYINYGVAYLDLSLEGLRLCGLFNEPGYFGTIVALTLIAYDVDLKRKGNIILLIAGILSASMAFFVLIGLYILAINILRPKRLFSILTVIIIAIFLLSQLNILPSELIDHVAGRFVFEDGKFVGDNRSSSDIDTALEYMLETGYKWFGYGDNMPIEQGTSLTYKYHVLKYGIIGAFLTWGSLLFTSLKLAKKTYGTFLFISLFFISIYQRPDIYVLCYFVILYSGLLYKTPTAEFKWNVKRKS